MCENCDAKVTKKTNKKQKLFRAMCIEKSKQKQNSPFQNKKW
jgi:hypothetical protein